jgi:hypothetical protein
MKIDLVFRFMTNTIKYLNLLAIGLIALIGCCTTTLASANHLDEAVIVPSGGERTLTAEDFRPHRPSGSAYNEIWSYSFLLNDGMQATFSLSYARLGGLMSPVSGAEFAISGFDGRSHRAAKEYGAEALTYTPAAGRLQVHPRIYVEGTLPHRHSVRFAAGKHGVDYDVALELTDIAAGLTWGDGVFRLGTDQIGMFLHIPYARVAGTVTIGGVTKRVTGTAYMDHTFQTNFPPRLVRSTYRYVQHGGTMEVGYLIAPHGRFEDRVVGIGAVREGGRFRLRKPEAAEVVSTRRSLGADVPRQLAVRFEGGAQTVLNRERDQQSFSALEELSGLQKGIVRRFIGGEVVVFRGRGTTNRGGRVAYDFLVVK